MSPISEREVFYGRSSCLIRRQSNSIALTELREAEAVEFLGVWIDISIPVDAITWSGDYRTRGNSHSIGKCEWT